MILGADGAKLSKRHGALSVTEYRTMGFMPEALLNYLVRLGWSHGDQELFTRQEMMDKFDFDHVSASPARFDMEKAYWVNHQYLKVTDPGLIAPEFDWHLRRLGVDPSGGPSLTAVIEQQRERCRTLVEMAEKSRFFFEALSGYSEKDAAKHLGPKAVPVLGALIEALSAADWQPEALHAAVHRVAEKRGLKLGDVAQPIRVAVAGMAVSPPIDQTLALLGRERSLSRLQAALKRAESTT
jgi:glutamyl-tRNA synthetase